ncbi:MADS-box protein AeAP3-2-like isoform X2 [Nymphaea colorata]|uniref:MADS-box protein AeAP3-2-like isoform X2 n=1 Tax=Nymphaea colorata TaxID=210225 RepID=UPI00129D860D|nr:MADS-box protein AeAP3-2-like isoform X2 [Nymphaea colorata]
MRRIENTTDRQVTFSDRRDGLLEKAHELAVLCDAQIGLIIFSSSGQMFEYCSPHSSMCQIIDRFKKASGTRIQEYDDKQIYCEMTKMKNENDKLRETMRHLTAEDLTTLTMTDLKHLDKQLEASLDRVRSREIQLLKEELDDLRRKEQCLLEVHNNEFSRALFERQKAKKPLVIDDPAPVDDFVTEDEQPRDLLQVIDAPPLVDDFGTFDQDEQSRDLLQLSPPFSNWLQPTQPNLQEPNFHHHACSSGCPADDEMSGMRIN